LGLVTPHKPYPVAPTLGQAEPAGDTSDVYVEHQLLGDSAGGESLRNVRLPDVPLPDVPLPDVASPDARPDGSVGME